MRTVSLRSEIDKQYMWNVESVFASDDDWEREFVAVGELIEGLSKFRGHLADSPDVLLQWFRASDELFQRVYIVFVYASMVHDVDTSNDAAQAKNDRATSLWGRAASGSAFAEPEILAIGSETIRDWMREMPDLALYEHYIDSLERRRQHVRSAEVEEVLGLVQDPFLSASNAHRTLADTDMRFEPVSTASGDRIEIAQGTIDGLLRDSDREVRRTAWEHYADSYLQYRNTIANILVAGVKQNVFTARSRRYASSLEAALEPHHIPLSVFHNLIDTYRRNLPIWHRYWRVRKAALGYEALHEYDIKAPLSVSDHRVPLQQAIEWVVAGMRPLGSDYAESMRRGVVDQRWVDVYPNRYKRSGAYSTGCKGTYPFILMNYDDDVESMSTLAHELGHSMHSYYANQAQPWLYADYSIFVAEVASNFNQALVRAYLLDSIDDPDFQIELIEEAMSNFHRYFFIMPALARLELEMHERVERDEGLTAETLIELTADLFREGYGDEVAMDVERTGITWAQFPNHLYANFYVYQYATGISAANALAQGVLSGAIGTADRYLQFLKAGGSLYPLDALKLAGVDMTSPRAVEQAFAVMEGMVDRLEGLVARRGSTSAQR